MWTKPTQALVCAIASLLFSGCEKPRSYEVAHDPEASEAAASQSPGRGNDREPIPNTTPPGSHVDPSSNAYIVFDGSGSMSGSPVEEAKRAVSSFIKGAPEELNIGLYVFDQNHQNGAELVPLGRGAAQRTKLLRTIAGIEAGGGTPLGAALRAGTNALIARFQMQLRYGDIRLIVVTDGEASDAHMFNASIRHALNHHVPIYTIGFRVRDAHPLRKYSEAYFTANDEQELLDAMKETLAELDDNADL